jgi:hypothetical protein
MKYSTEDLEHYKKSIIKYGCICILYADYNKTVSILVELYINKLIDKQEYLAGYDYMYSYYKDKQDIDITPYMIEYYLGLIDGIPRIKK